MPRWRSFLLGCLVSFGLSALSFYLFVIHNLSSPSSSFSLLPDCQDCGYRALPPAPSPPSSSSSPFAHHPHILRGIFQRHCNWTAPEAWLQRISRSEYAIPDLVEASVLHCNQSTLPFPGVDLWHHHADVAILGDGIRGLEQELDRQCNQPGQQACVIFLLTQLIHNPIYGAPLLLRAVHQPFILLTASNIPECVPYRTFPRTDLAMNVTPEVDQLIQSPLLLRWYSKNMCLHPGHTGGKLQALPLGPRWQFVSRELDGEPKAPIKAALVQAGANDPRAAFDPQHREDSLYVAMDTSTTNKPFFRFHKYIRYRAEEYFTTTWPQRGYDHHPSGYRLAIHDKRVDYKAYLNHLRQHKFILSPPGWGLDCHRTWEALLLGAVPVVWHTPLNHLYSQLPVVVIHDDSDVTPSAMEGWTSHVYDNQRGGHAYHWERLYAFFWLEQIEKERLGIRAP